MSRPVPTIGDLMTAVPRTLEATDTALEAKELMLTADIRHVPVVRDGKLVGIVSARDVDVVLAAIQGLRDAPKLGEICETNPYAVAPDAPVTDVALEMELRKVGSAVVTDREGVIGIFTLIDALRALRIAYAAKKA